MEARRYDDPEAFSARVTELLRRDPGRHSLVFGILDTLRYHPGAYPSFVLVAAEEGDRVMGVALHTEPHLVVLARPENDDALAALATAMQELSPTAPGVIGGRPEADAFAARWIEDRGGSLRIENRQGIYELTTVRTHGDAGGAMRVARRDDVALVFEWEEAFLREAVPGHPGDPDDRRRQVERVMLSGGYRLWEHDDRPVSLTGVHQAPPVGARIGPVYTPPEERGKGYATALVAAASQEQLDAGRPACYLHTDLANTTSNAIYQRIGYEWVCEAIDLRFVT